MKHTTQLAGNGIRLFKYLPILVCVSLVGTLFTSCGGLSLSGSGLYPSGSGDDDERVGPLKTTTTSPYKDFNFVLFDASELSYNFTASNGRYYIPEGNWKGTYINESSVEGNTKYYEYFEFESPVSGSITTKKEIKITRTTLTNEEISEIEDMDPLTFNFYWCTSLSDSFDYYLDGNDFVRIYVYNEGNQYFDNIFYKEMSCRTYDIPPKTNSDNSQIYDAASDGSIKLHLKKIVN